MRTRLSLTPAEGKLEPTQNSETRFATPCKARSISRSRSRSVTKTSTRLVRPSKHKQVGIEGAMLPNVVLTTRRSCLLRRSTIDYNSHGGSDFEDWDDSSRRWMPLRRTSLRDACGTPTHH